MSYPQLPPATSHEHEFLAGICQRLDNQNEQIASQNELLAQILDRLPAATHAVRSGEPGPIALREPAIAIDAAAPSGDPSPESQTPARKRAPAKKAPARAAKGTTS